MHNEVTTVKVGSLTQQTKLLGDPERTFLEASYPPSSKDTSQACKELGAGVAAFVPQQLVVLLGAWQ